MRVDSRLLRGVAITAIAIALLPSIVAAVRRNRATIALVPLIARSPEAAAYSPCGVPAGARDAAALKTASAAAARGTTAGEFRNAGSALLAAGDAEAAATMFDRALQRDRNDAPAILRRAQIASEKGDVARAAGLLRRFPQASTQLVSDGYGRVAMNDMRGAARCFDIAIALDPEAAEGHLGKGRLLLRERQADGAFAELDRAAQLCPRCADAVFYRAFARLLRGEAADRVERDLKTAVALAPDDVDILSGWANWLSSAGRKSEAESIWKRVKERV